MSWRFPPAQMLPPAKSYGVPARDAAANFEAAARYLRERYGRPWSTFASDSGRYTREEPGMDQDQVEVGLRADIGKAIADLERMRDALADGHVHAAALGLATALVTLKHGEESRRRVEVARRAFVLDPLTPAADPFVGVPAHGGYPDDDVVDAEVGPSDVFLRCEECGWVLPEPNTSITERCAYELIDGEGPCGGRMVPRFIDVDGVEKDAPVCGKRMRGVPVTSGSSAECVLAPGHEPPCMDEKGYEGRMDGETPAQAATRRAWEEGYTGTTRAEAHGRMVHTWLRAEGRRQLALAEEELIGELADRLAHRAANLAGTCYAQGGTPPPVGMFRANFRKVIETVRDERRQGEHNHAPEHDCAASCPQWTKPPAPTALSRMSDARSCLNTALSNAVMDDVRRHVIAAIRWLDQGIEEQRGDGECRPGAGGASRARGGPA